LAEALRVEPDLLAFVDDDETVQPGWLAAHAEVLERAGADASFGPALPDYDQDVAHWISRMGFFEPARYATGDQVWFPATNNTVFRTSLLDALEGAFFDPAYGLTGGGDFEFFKRAQLNAAATYVWCDEAITHEHVPCSRANARWLWRRWRRIGYGWYHKDERNMAPVLIRAAVNILAAPVLAAFRALPGTDPGKTSGKALLHIALGVGAIEGCLGRPRIVEYGRSAPEVSL
jgi:GT2 family glycosyltransferase